MDDSKLHPSVQDFKLFLKSNPKIVKDVRMGKKTWQEIYEDWSLLGDQDEVWNEYKEEKKEKDETEKTDKGEFISQLLNQLKKMDPDQIQKQIGNFSQVLGVVQGVISQFQSSGQSESAPPSVQNNHPFKFRQD
ncbi:spore coat protein YlbD [Bacillus sp. D386]|uniref:spore coat protein YlbD n=1 Tax=Bacillus sp. D386 TaxID=2587155 RepID=UPI0011247757|nr:spore coat protein YlbD [Bacillus sp. D386]